MKLLRLLAVAAMFCRLSSRRRRCAQRAPAAAPTGDAADSSDLAAPDAAPTGPSMSRRPAAIAAIRRSAASPSSRMFMRADMVVKTVMILLLLASLWSWTIIFNKWLALGSLKRKARAKFEKIFWSGQSLDELYQQFSARDRSSHGGDVRRRRCANGAAAFEGGAPREAMLAGVKDRIDKAMSVTILRETDGIERQLGFLATVGSMAPFVGLFGTVWGIMNSLLGHRRAP